MRAFGVEELRESTAEILLRWRHGKFDAFRLHLLVKVLQVFYGEPDVLSAGAIFLAGRVQREGRLAGGEFRPAWGSEL
jgi:hypothetical protein